MNGPRLAAIMLAMYAVLLIANAILYYSWSGDSSELWDLLIRVGGLALITFGLWKSQRWAWWLGLFCSLFLGLTGTLLLVIAKITDHFAGRPYPIADYSILTISAILLIGTVIVLLLPKSREVVRKSG